MKIELVAAAVIATAFIVPVYAQEKPATETPKADAPKVQRNAPSKRHSHLEERQGIKPAAQAVKKSAAVDKSKHYHPRDR